MVKRIATWLIVRAIIAILAIVVGGSIGNYIVSHYLLLSPGGRYQARLVTNYDTNYEITNREGVTLLVTEATYSTANSVKTGGFCPYTLNPIFVAIYHYGHSGPVSVAMIYNIETGDKTVKRENGYRYDYDWGC